MNLDKIGPAQVKIPIEQANRPAPKKLTLAKKIENFLKVIKVAIKSLLNLSNYKISHIDMKKIPPDLVEKLKQFEASFSYPFNDQERFRIEHGKNGDYFSFFKSLGKVHYYVVTCKKDEKIITNINGKKEVFERKAGEIAAVGCAVLRKLKTPKGKTIKAWYVCDLKVGQKYQGEHIPVMLAQKAAWRLFQCPRGYGICMNPAQGQPKAAEIWRKHSPIKGSHTKTFNLYALTEEEVNNHRKPIMAALIENGYLKKNEHLNFTSTNGHKDYQIFGDDEQKTRPWNLLHMTRNGVAENSEPKKDHIHMISAVKGSLLDKSLQLITKPASTAQIVSYGMENYDFNRITSSEI